VSDVAPARVAAVVAEGHVRLVVDLTEADNDRLLKDLKRINESEAQMYRQRGHQWELPAWRVALWDAASAAVSNIVATHRVSRTPTGGFALGSLAHAITTHEAAEALGVSLQRVRHMCRTGKLRAEQAVGGNRGWSIDAEAVGAIAAARGRSVGDAPPLADRPAVLGG